MTIHINDFEKPAALEDIRLQELTGCPIHKAIDSVCTEPGCPNNGAFVEMFERLQKEACRQESGKHSCPTEKLSAQAEDSIYQTESRMRCIL